MPEYPKKPKRPGDLNVLASKIVEKATEGEPLSDEKRQDSKIPRKAAKARSAKKPKS